MRWLPYFFLTGLAFLAVLVGIPAIAFPPTETLVILETSDLHGHLLPWDYYGDRPEEWGLAKIATLIRQERDRQPNVLLIDDGDTIQGTPLTDYFNQIDTATPDPMAVTMNALQFDAVVLGNHDFDYGRGVLQRWIEQLDCPVLAANILNQDGTPAYTPYIVREINGIRVGILGLIVDAVPRWLPSELIEGLQFVDPVATAQRYVPQMRDAGVDVVVVAQHTGWSRVPAERQNADAWLTDPATWEDAGTLWRENVTLELAQQVPGIDAILAGHSHLDVPKAVVNGVLIAEPSFWGKALSKFTLQLRRDRDRWRVDSKDATNLYAEGVAPDPELAALAQPYHQQTLRYIEQPIGSATAEFFGGMPARYIDSPLADLIAQVQLEAAAAAGYPADISLTAIFTDTGKLPQGTVTRRDVYGVYVFNNLLCVVEVTGEGLRQALERNAEYFQQVDADALPEDPTAVLAPNAPGYNWDLYTGIDYTIDITRPVGDRVTRLQWQGQDVQPQDRFRVALNSFRAQGGGGYPMFAEGRVLWRSQTAIRDLLVDYIQARGAIAPEAINQQNFQLIPDLGDRYFPQLANR